MRKNDVIKMLQSIKGNPQILLYNGFVGDWQHIHLVESEVSKLRKDVLAPVLKFQYNMTDEEIDKRYKKEQWEYDEYGFDVPEQRVTKRVIFIDAKPRGKKSFDRAGTIRY